jgi:mannose-6-phosphate isomerase-like protein (cupin superfamily)
VLEAQGPIQMEVKLKQYALKNELYRKVVFTGSHSQLVAMNILNGEETEKESHHADTIVFVVKGKGKSVLEGRSRDIVKHDLVFVPTRRYTVCSIQGIAI